ncbi:MAG: hypothetical protein AB7I27_12055 [Bacteriovoracaceae bacterium]
MKNTSIAMLMIAFLSPAAFAAKQISCDLKIPDNKVSCGLRSFINCPERILKESSTKFDVVLDDGEDKEIEIKLKKIVHYPDKDKEKQDESEITIFGDDQRDQKLMDEKGANIASYIMGKGIKVKIQYRSEGMNVKLSDRSVDGDTYIKITGQNGENQRLVFDGNYRLDSYAYLVDNHGLKINCEVKDRVETAAEINQDEQNKKQALANYEKSKKERQQKRAEKDAARGEEF